MTELPHFGRRLLAPGAAGAEHARMRTLWNTFRGAASSLRRREEGAIGWLLIGVLVGIGLVIFGVYKLFF
jgi:hypothetical protein